MSEQFANLASSSLASAYTAGSGSITVVNATPFPTSGTFTLVIRDQSTKAVKLLFRVTSVSGAVFTGASEGTDAAANAGDLVDGTMVTVASLAQFKADILAAVPPAPIPTLFTQTVQTNINTTGEQSIVGSGSGSLILPANFYVPGKNLRFEASGFFSTTGSPGTLTARLKHSGGLSGLVLVIFTGPMNLPLSITNGVWRWRGFVTCQSTTPPPQAKLLCDTLFEMSTGGNFPAFLSTPTIVDFSSTQTVDLTMQFSVAGQSITMTNFVLVQE